MVSYVGNRPYLWCLVCAYHGDVDVFDIIAFCPLGAAVDVHPLCVCPGTEELYYALATSVTVPSQSSTSLVVFVLFTHNPPPQHRRPVLEYVGRAFSMSMSTYFIKWDDLAR